MRVNGPGAPGILSRPRDVGRAGSGAAFVAGVPSAATRTSDAAGAARAAALTTLDAVLALQALPDASERRRRAVRRGHELLDRLEEIRLALLAGDLPLSTLQRLRRELAGDERVAEDPKLMGILGEIELRTAVEIAKLEVAGVAG